MSWFTRFKARMGAIQRTANWACVQYIGARAKWPNLRDSELIEAMLELRPVIPLDSVKEDRMWVRMALITNVTELAWQVLSIETDDGTDTSPFRSREWVDEARKTIEKVVRVNQLRAEAKRGVIAAMRSDILNKRTKRPSAVRVGSWLGGF